MKQSVRTIIDEIIKSNNHRVYQTGNSFLPHSTRDYDFFVYCSRDVSDLVNLWSIKYAELGISEVFGESIGNVNSDIITYTCANSSEHLFKHKQYYPDVIFIETNPIPTFDIDLSLF